MREILEELRRQADREVLKIAPQAQRKYKKVSIKTKNEFLDMVFNQHVSIKKVSCCGFLQELKRKEGSVCKIKINE
jgi:hypothetical protein